MKKLFALLITLVFLLDSCCDEDFIIPDYDFYKFAIDVSEYMNGECSQPLFTTVGATSDGSQAECSPDPQFNRWFKFRTTSSEQVTINIMGETLQNPILVLWEKDGVTDVTCETYSYMGQLSLYEGNLIGDEWYYFTVDATDEASNGTFGICLSDSD